MASDGAVRLPHPRPGTATVVWSATVHLLAKVPDYFTAKLCIYKPLHYQPPVDVGGCSHRSAPPTIHCTHTHTATSVNSASYPQRDGK